MDQVNNLNLKYTKAEAEDRVEVTKTDIIMISEVIRIDIDQIGDSIDKTEADQGIHKIMVEDILEVT